MKLPPFEYACPTELSEAVALLAAHNGDAKPIAGGQSLVPMLAFRLAAPSLLVDLRKLPDLRKIEISATGVTLGAMVRWREIPAHLPSAPGRRRHTGRALSDPQPRHDRGQRRPRRPGRGDSRHRGDL
jgi:CO/xanthine dehydrogenase FAD-binding subunit